MISYETFTLVSLWVGYVAVVFLLLLVFALAGFMTNHYLNRGWFKLFDNHRVAAWLKRAADHYQQIEPMPEKK